MRIGIAVLVVLMGLPPSLFATPPLYVLLWFDTEDFVMPQSDDAARDVAQLLTSRHIRATFKVVGEKARVLARRGRRDVIDALAAHEIGYHSDRHSVHPTPAEACASLSWEEGVEAFDAAQRGGFEMVQRLFGQAPSCYGQPGKSWVPQAYSVLRRWKVPVYLDDGPHVGLEGGPHYYCGVLNLFHLRHTLRCELRSANDLVVARERLNHSVAALRAAGGGFISIYYHPCEFVQRRFWDAVNFARGANPPPPWKQPPARTPAERALALANFNGFLDTLHAIPGVRFITARDAAALLADQAQGRVFQPKEILEIAQAVQPDITDQVRGGVALSPAEILALLVPAYLDMVNERTLQRQTLGASPLGPLRPDSGRPVESLSREAFTRIANELRMEMRRSGHLPALPGIPLTSYLVAVAHAIRSLAAGHSLPAQMALSPARLRYETEIPEDQSRLWSWPILPETFRAPKLMELARLQAWTLKHAILSN